MDNKIKLKIESEVLKKLLTHLQNRTDVQNIDLMNLSGFCRNCLSRAGLEFDVCNSHGLHYSNTLMVWRDEFLKKWDSISKQGFDLTFKRMWDFYLSYCEAGFKSKNIDLIQFSIQNK